MPCCRPNVLSLRISSIQLIIMAELNRLKVVLVEKKKTARWLADKMGKDPATISKWCTNTSQPSIETLAKVAKLLEADIRDLLIPTNKE
ncbi:hypothetical protein HMPREF1212_02340 [Parabacteroides sp. HGS0025]|nr:hypothetical protein HMPREF1212_02340 [Parabacteroides sp. HGS0025]